MNIRHLVTKDFDNENKMRRSVIFDGAPIISQDIVSNVTLDYSKDLKDSEKNQIEPNIQRGRQNLLDSPIGGIISKNNKDILALSSLFDFKVRPDTPLAEDLPEGTTFENIFNSPDVKDYLAETALNMFPHTNPNTGLPDIDLDSKYTPYIPLVIATNTMSTQIDGDKVYFNPQGTVSIAEFLDGLNAIKYGMNSNRLRKKTLDNISDEEDYFNEGYNECLNGLSGLFFNLYTRKELLQPITRCEMAYIITLCWTQFMDKYNGLYGGQFYLGFNFDWENPVDMLVLYEDGVEYKISKIIKDTEYNIISLDVRDYKSIYSMEQFKQNMKNGINAIPISLFMPLMELDILGIFDFDGELAPLKELSREELAYTLTKLSQLFSIKYNYSTK